MTLQDTYLAALGGLGQIVREVDEDSGIVELAEDYHARVAQFRVLVPLVGSFNAGKTSLLNAWLERPEGTGLPTDIVPQTALATEIHLAGSADAEAVELYGKDDRMLKRIDLAEFERIEKQALTTGESDAEYARATVHAPARHGADWSATKVLVDMPGLDSGLRTHNAAIQRYLPLGSYFVLVVDVENGALRETEIGQLREFLEQDVEFVVLINKSEKKKNDLPAIVAHIDKQVREAFGKSVGVFPVSAHAPDIAAFRKVVEEIDFGRALRSFWQARTLTLFDDAIRSLHTRYSALNVSSAESERTVAKLEEEMQTLEAKLRDDEQEVRGRYSDRAVERIVRSARDAIRDDAVSLAQTWQAAGQQAFEHQLNELVRQTLNRVVDKERKATLGQIMDRYEADLDDIDALHERFIRAGEDAAVLEVPNEFAGHVRGAAQASARAFDQAKTRVAGATISYTAVTGILAAATSIVAPWLEVVIIALPALLNWLAKKQEEKQRQQREQEQLQQLQSQISSVVAARIATDLRGRVAEDFESNTKDMIALLRKQVKAGVVQIQADINRSRAEIEEQKRDVEQRKGQLRSAISRLTETRKSVEEV